MTANGWIQIALYCVLVPIVREAARRLHGRRVQRRADVPVAAGRPVERGILPRCAASTSARSSTGTTYGVGDAAVSRRGLRCCSTRCSGCKHFCRFNPQGQARSSPESAFNTAVSFMTNTNWQAYGGETTMGYLVQMAGLTVQNFVSAAAGIALAIALIRGFARRSAQTIGNFWVDLTRCDALRPAAAVDRRARWCSVWQGVPQNLGAYTDATTLEGAKQVIAQGPVASQDSDQAARHQRRRLLQRQFRASLREPERRSPT